jgi:hypothetical protein
MFRYILSLLSLFTFLNAEIIPFKILDTSNTPTQKSIKILDTVELKFASIDGIKVRELSDIAYKDKVLYSVGDRGILYRFELKLKNDKIKKVEPLSAIRLQSKKKKFFSKSQRDSEGLDFYGDNLLISYEREPRIELRSCNARKYKNIKIDKKLQHIKNYESANKALESVAYSKKYGVITAPELPLYGKNEHKIYSKSKSWKFKKEGGITSLTFMNKHEIMILQRKHSYFTFRTQIVLSKLNLKTKNYTILAKFDSFDGWNLDNFEGLTKVGKNRYLMISDDNDSFIQKTLLVLFKVVE